MSRIKKNIEIRFWDKVEITDGCWLWKGRSTSNGYGVFDIASSKAIVAHRFSYLLIKEIPEGLHLDHLCRQRLCVKPEHLEAVTQAENNRRANLLRRINPAIPKWYPRSHCYRGHLLTSENTAIGRDGERVKRRCRICQRAKEREGYWRKKINTHYGFQMV